LNPCPEGINFSLISRLLFLLTSMCFAVDDGKIDPSDLHGVFKLFFKNRFSLTTYERQSAQVMRICNAWQRATISRNVVAAFR
jgi:hypothetical protein